MIIFNNIIIHVNDNAYNNFLAYDCLAKLMHGYNHGFISWNFEF